MTDSRTVDFPRASWPGDRPEVPRPPGRVLFDPEGYDHLRETVGRELDDMLNAGLANGSSPMPRSGNPLFDDITAILDEVTLAIEHAAALYGAPLATAVAGGRTEDRFKRVGAALRYIDERLAAAESAYASESAEVERLTRELGRAQVAYDDRRDAAMAEAGRAASIRSLLSTALDDLGVQRALAEVFAEELGHAYRGRGWSARSIGSTIGAARRRALKLAQSRRHPDGNTQEETTRDE